MATEVDIPTLEPMEQIRLDFEAGLFDLSEDFDGEEFAHYAPKDGLMEAMINGSNIRALCGWVFIPMRDPEKFPICPRCAEVRSMLPD